MTCSAPGVKVTMSQVCEKLLAMTDLTRTPGLYHASWNDWVAMGQQRSAVGLLAEWFETSPRPSKAILLNAKEREHEQGVVPGVLACCPDVALGDLTDVVSVTKSGASVLALFPDERVAEQLIDNVDPATADLCLVLWPGFDDLELWLQAHGAIELPSGMPAGRGFLDRIPPVVRAALPKSKEVMDTFGGLRNGRGKDELVQTLQLLHANGYLCEPRDLALYSFHLGFRLRDVKCIEDYAARIRQGRRITTGNKRLRSDAFERWMAGAEKIDGQE